MQRHIAHWTDRLGRLLGVVTWAANDRLKHYRARLHRSRLTDVTFVAITGSAGKTTTKDLAAAVLAVRGPTHRNHGTANQHAYLDDTVRGVTPHHRYSVLEVSADRPGYLDRPLRLIRPQISVLTLIAREHYSAFRSLEAIAKEKGKLISALPRDGIAVLNIDDPYVRQIGERRDGKVIWVGQDEGATIRLLGCESVWPHPLSLQLLYQGNVFTVPTRIYGTHLAMPVALALGVGVAAGIQLGDAIAAVGKVEPVEGRMQIKVRDDGVVFLRDDWKAPQWSLHAPFRFMKDAQANRKIIVLGSISDSPKSPSQRYAQAARDALQNADLVLLVGTAAAGGDKLRDEKTSGLIKAFVNLQDAADFLKRELQRGDLVLLKGTNKQDHLVRLVMDGYRPVQCWTNDCGIPRFCTSCDRIYDRAPGRQDAPENGPDSLGVARFSNSPVVVGLGNHGTKYGRTPHNVGHLVVDAIAPSSPGGWLKQGEGWTRTVVVNGQQLTLFKPAGAMNTSGPLISSYLARTGRSPDDCIVVHDDADLSLGDWRAKSGGGDGGHKGVRSLMIALGTNRFLRVRVGVRKVGDTRSARDLVLIPFSPADEAELQAAVNVAGAAVLSVVREMQKQPPQVQEAAPA
jgi:UDP-N-acetylmuramoyl-tripeptide--D-alanyl-D-alanine ligase